MYIVEDNVLWHFGGPSDHTGRHENWFQGCKIDLITHPKPCNGYSFPLVFPRRSIYFINIHEYANEIIFILTHGINKFVILYHWFNKEASQ